MVQRVCHGTTGACLQCMSFDPQTPVAAIVLDHSECAAVFARHHIDYCCKGKRPLAEVCGDHGLSLPTILDELDLAVRRRSPLTVEPKDVSTRELITSVIARHHRYLHRALPVLGELAAKVARVHGSREPSLAEVSRLVTEIVVTFQAHLKDEEEVLFPALLAEQPGDVAAQLAAMRSEHDQVGALLEAVRRAAADFVAPEWACNSYRTLMKELAELESDTLRHVHIENHVLLPRFAS